MHTTQTILYIYSLIRKIEILEMAIQKQFNFGGGKRSPFGGIGAIIMLILSIVLIYMVVKGIFTLLFWLSIPLFIAGVAIDFKGALQLGKSAIQLAKKNPLIPLGIVILSALWFPVVPGILAALTGGFLLTRKFVKKKFESVMGQQQPKEEEDFTEYEEVSEEEDFLELPEIEKQAQTNSKSGDNNEYDNLFD